MSRRSALSNEPSDEKTLGEGISPATDESSDAPVASDIAPSASEEQATGEFQSSGAAVNLFLLQAEQDLNGDRGRATLIGVSVVARAIVFAGLVIASAIRESRPSTS